MQRPDHYSAHTQLRHRQSLAGMHPCSTCRHDPTIPPDKFFSTQPTGPSTKCMAHCHHFLDKMPSPHLFLTRACSTLPAPTQPEPHRLLRKKPRYYKATTFRVQSLLTHPLPSSKVSKLGQRDALRTDAPRQAFSTSSLVFALPGAPRTEQVSLLHFRPNAHCDMQPASPSALIYLCPAGLPSVALLVPNAKQQIVAARFSEPVLLLHAPHMLHVASRSTTQLLACRHLPSFARPFLSRCLM